MLIYPYPYGDTSISALFLPALLAVGGMMFTTFAYPNINSVLSDVIIPEHRGTIFAFYSVLNNLGWTLGPTVYTLLFSTFANTMGQIQAMTSAAVLIVSLWLIALLCWIGIYRSYPKEKL